MLIKLNSGCIYLHRNRWVSLYDLLHFARPKCFFSCYSFVIRSCTYAMPCLYLPWKHSTNKGVRYIRSNSARSMLISNGLRLPRRGIEPGHPGFETTALPLGHSPYLINIIVAFHHLKFHRLTIFANPIA